MGKNRILINGAVGFSPLKEKPVALIYGMGGQDAFYLADLLLSKGYRVIGGVRRSSQPRDYLIPLLERGLEIVECDITDYSSVEQVVRKYSPNHIYNLAAQSHVATSFTQPLYTWDVTAKGVLNILEVVRTVNPFIRVYQASSSEMFGKSVTEISSRTTHWTAEGVPCGGVILGTPERYQDENTIFTPQSPYAIAKLAAHQAIRLYRESYNLFACAGVLFNHESERRGEMFVTRKITKYVGQLKVWLDQVEQDESAGGYNLQSDIRVGQVTVCRANKNKEPYGHRDSWAFGPSFPKLKLGNLSACRDWSHAEDMVTAMVMMLEADTPDDYVVGSGETYSVEQFVEAAFNSIGKNWKDYVEIDQSLMRPAEVDYLRSNPSKIKNALGWEPKLDFNGLVKRMVDFDIKRAEQKMKMYGSVC